MNLLRTMKHTGQLKAVITSIYIQIRYSEWCKIWVQCLSGFSKCTHQLQLAVHDDCHSIASLYPIVLALLRSNHVIPLAESLWMKAIFQSPNMQLVISNLHSSLNIPDKVRARNRKQEFFYLPLLFPEKSHIITDNSKPDLLFHFCIDKQWQLRIKLHKHVLGLI